MERARVAAWLSLSNEVKERDYYLEVLEIMPHESKISERVRTSVIEYCLNEVKEGVNFLLFHEHKMRKNTMETYIVRRRKGVAN